MVRIILFLLLLPNLLWAYEIEQISYRGELKKDDNGRIETGVDSSALFYYKDRAVIKVLSSSVVETHGDFKLLSGKINLTTDDNAAFDVFLAGERSFKVQGNSVLAVSDTATVVCVDKGSTFTIGNLTIVGNSDEFTCFEQTSEGWITTDGKLAEYRSAFLFEMNNKINVDGEPGNLPEIKKAKTRKTDGPKNVDKEDAESGSGGGSVCLDSEGQGAGDISGTETEIEVEQGKANVTVRVEIGD